VCRIAPDSGSPVDLIARVDSGSIVQAMPLPNSRRHPLSVRMIVLENRFTLFRIMR
jgi:hypothetical protein